MLELVHSIPILYHSRCVKMKMNSRKANSRNADFVSPLHTKLIRIWTGVSKYAAYLPQSLCEHTDGWYRLDLNLAVCVACHTVHACGGSKCQTFHNDEGFNVCPITGCLVGTLSYSTNEYVDTAVSHDPDRVDVVLNYEQRLAQSSEIIFMYIVELLDGPGWQKCMENETVRIQERRNNCFVRAIKTSKMITPTVYPNIYHAVCSMMTATKNMRSMHLSNQASRRELARWCADTIGRHICVLNQLSPLSVPENKLRQSVIGLLYLMRSGVIFHDTIVLPRCETLSTVLPLEACLETNFRIKGKCITEMENLVKGVFRSSSRTELTRLGLYAVDVLL
jgi:hypothetical protein